MRVPNLRGEEFEEAIGRARAGGGDKGGSVRRDDRGELVHVQTPRMVAGTKAKPAAIDA